MIASRLIGLLTVAFAHCALAEVRLPAIFSEHMVLQRSPATPIWGWADPGEEILISIAGTRASATTDAQGRWKTALDLEKTAAGPHTLSVRGRNTISIPDTMIGEVWLASGQSNMLFRLHKTSEGRAEVANSSNPFLREFAIAEAARF